MAKRRIKGFRRRRCRVCGSRRVVIAWAGGTVPAGEVAVAAGAVAGPPAPVAVRWRCRRCGASMGLGDLPASLWQRRRPLASWLFSERA